MTQHIVSFSGGKDSTAMLLMMLEKGMKIDRVICVDTTKEFPGMYSHIEQVQKIVYPLEIEIIKIDFDYWFGEHIIKKGVNINKKGYGWTGNKGRWCTALKINAIKKIIKKDSYEYIGIAFDESKRLDKKYLKNINKKTPLFDWQITGKQALEYCYDKGLNWNGLYESFGRVSCYCCPLQPISCLRKLYNKYPELWNQIKEMDKKSFRRFRSDYSINDLENKFLNENKQGRLF